MPESAPLPQFETYEDFWPYYVAMHSLPITRWLHAIGTLGGAAVAADGLLRRRSLRALGWFPTLGYGFAWPAHFILERNNPASFGHPAWSFRGDLQMIRMMLTGRDQELSAIAEKWFADYPGTARRRPHGRPPHGRSYLTSNRTL